MSTHSLARRGPSSVPPDGTPNGGEREAETTEATLKRHLRGEWPLHQPPWRSRSSWDDVRRGRLRMSADDVDWVFRSRRPKAQQALSEVSERLVALRRERRQGERRRLA